MFLALDHISKHYGSKKILVDVSFNLPAHGTMSILGKSGCGKSTLLKVVAGLDLQDSGTIYLENKDISTLNANQRNIVYLFQEALLFPHLNVFENIAFGLRIRKENSTVIKDKVEAMLQSLELTEHSVKMPHQLSGGQKQRVAFGRALIINPPLILLDEPFSSLDVEIRASMQQLYKRIAEQFNITALFVTHDLKEALLMGDRIAYMENGALKIFDTKEEFINDTRTGVQNEISFWNNLNV
jgi:ABC-type Fe3+/spermidine/putrescine transport system ATPase subunit